MTTEQGPGPVLFAGLGRMGLPMALHLRVAGVRVLGFDPAEDARDAFAGQGGETVASVREGVAQADAVLVMVGTEAQARDVIDGADGVLAHAEPGTLVVLLSTMAPTAVAGIGERAAGRGVRVLDAPVCRAESGAKDGTLLALVAGAGEDHERAHPILSAFSSDIVHLGERLGSAQIAKTVNNLLLWAAVAANHEGLSLAREWGMDEEHLRRVLQTSTGDNWSLRHWENAAAWRWSIKDMQIAVDVADDLDVSAPLTGVLSQLVRDIPELTHAHRKDGT